MMWLDTVIGIGIGIAVAVAVAMAAQRRSMR